MPYRLRLVNVSPELHQMVQRAVDALEARRPVAEEREVVVVPDDPERTRYYVQVITPTSARGARVSSGPEPDDLASVLEGLVLLLG